MDCFVLYVSAVLMAFVSTVYTVLWAAWSIPSFRRRLASPHVPISFNTGVLTDLSARIGNALISTGIAVCALAGWYGCCGVLAALIVGSR